MNSQPTPVVSVDTQQETSIYALRQTGIVFFLFYVVLCVVSIASPEFFSDLEDYILELVGQAVAVTLIWKARPHWRDSHAAMARVWYYFLMGAIFFFAGDLLWFYLEYFRQQDMKSPSYPDILYITSYIFLLAGLGLYIQIKKTRSLKMVFFDILISFLTLSLIIIRFGIIPTLEIEGKSGIDDLVNLFYPLADVLFLIGLMALVFISSRTRELLREVGLIAAGFICFLIVDQAFLLLGENENFLDFTLDTLWSIGLLFLSLGALYASVNDNQSQELDDSHVANSVIYFLQTILPYIFALVLVAMLIWESGFEDMAISLINLVVFLIILRQVDVLMQQRKLTAALLRTQNEIKSRQALLALQQNQLIEAHEQKTSEANTDFLTQLKNRRFVNEALDKIGETSSVNVNLGLILIDVDYFKPINDTYGHQMGDDVLCLVAKAITSVARGTDIAGRFGGDEFILILPGADDATLAKVCQRLTQAIAETPLPKPDMKLSLSIGAAAWSSPRADYKKEDLLLRADLALYEVKEAGRNGWRVYEKRD